MNISAFFTQQGTPKTGLSPTIRIRDISDTSLVITDAVMTEVGDGYYTYNFATYTDSTPYCFRCDSIALTGYDRYTYGGNYFDLEDGNLYILAFFTERGIPKTGLSATLRMRDLSDNSLVVTDEAMTEVGDGFYKYLYTSYDASKNYTIRCDGSNTLTYYDRYTYGGRILKGDYGTQDHYSTKQQIEFRLNYQINDSTRPTASELDGIMDDATSIINAEMMVESNIVDTFGDLRVIEINLVLKIINNVYALAEPEDYAYLEVELTPEDKRLIHMTYRKWASLHWDMG